MSSWLITGAFVMVLGVGIAVDLTGQVHAQTRLMNVAGEAARTGGQELDREAAITGEGNAINARQAVTAANRYLAAAGVDGSATMRGGDVVVVDTSGVYETKFLSIIAITELTATGHGEARAVHVVNGVEQ